jgi:hypothetical protein
MKYQIEKSGGTLKIKIENVGENKDKVLENFQLCQQGRCGCPTTEYEKLESLTIEPGEDNVSLHLSPRSGQALKQEQIERCLDFTIETASKHDPA